MMKTLNDLTIREFYEFQELIKDEEPDIYSIFELFGKDASNMNFDVFNQEWLRIKSMKVDKKGVHLHYKVKGRRFKSCLNPFTIKAGQFIDLQYIMSNGAKIEDILSIFLLPQKKTLLGYKTLKYNSGYDILEVRKFLLDNFTIGDAQALSAFFLNLSNKVLKVSIQYLEKKKWKEKLKLQKTQHQSLNGSKQ